MKIGYRYALIAVLALAGCTKHETDSKSDSKSEKSEKHAKSGASASSATSNAEFGPDSVAIEFTGQYRDVDNEKQVPVFKVTNKFGKNLFYLKVWYYSYDAAGKQIGRRFFERYSLNMNPGASEEMALGAGKAEMAKGDIKTIQAVVVGSTYADKGKWDGDVGVLAPDQRPMK